VKLLKVLIVDDDEEQIEMLEELLKCNHPDVKVVAKAENIDDAYAAILAFRPDLVFLDVEMPNGNGIDFARRLREDRISVKIVIISGKAEYALDAIKVSVFDYILKPYKPKDISRILAKVKAENLLVSLNRERAILFSLFFEKISIESDALTTYFIKADEILYYKVVDLRHIELHVFWQDEPIIVPETVTTLRKKIPILIFYQITRRVFINLKYLSKISQKNHKCTLNYNGKLFTLNGSENQLAYLKRRILEKSKKRVSFD